MLPPFRTRSASLPRRGGAAFAATGAGRAPLAVRAAIIASVALLPHATASACPSCYGAAAGPVIDGMNVAVLVMVGVTGGVFSWIGAFAIRIARRERTPAGDGVALKQSGEAHTRR